MVIVVLDSPRLRGLPDLVEFCLFIELILSMVKCSNAWFNGYYRIVFTAVVLLYNHYVRAVSEDWSHKCLALWLDQR